MRPEPSSVIEIADLTLGYGNNSVITDLSMKLPGGSVTALIGPNGCGKSTLLKSLARILRPGKGSIHVDGVSIDTYSATALARQIAFLPQVLPVPEGITVRQLVSYGRSPYSGLWGRLGSGDRVAIDSALSQLDIEHISGVQVSDLSGGQRQRVWIAMIVAQQTPIVLMDEPTTYLDINHQIEVLRFARQLAKEGKAVVMVLHDLNQAFRYADVIGVMRGGKITAFGRAQDIVTETMLRDVFHIDVSVALDPEANTPMIIVRHEG